ncbi:MAG: GGDEF domain-containing protein [Methylophilaceae bacterium]|nr:GGDEF domain-containing protein [Methylophilaceae bacterium]
MPQLLRYLCDITAQRDRARLEKHVVRTLYDFLGVQQVSIHRLYMVQDKPLTGITTWADASGLHHVDDDLCWPKGTIPLAEHPQLQQIYQDGIEKTETATQGRLVTALPIQRGEQLFGFVEIIHEQALQAQQIETLRDLTTIYSNCIALLDYSEIDSLTGLLNRKTFDEKLIKILSQMNAHGDASRHDHNGVPSRREGHYGGDKQHWLAVIDIDFFKRVNDNFGHLMGDEILLLVATLMKRSFRGEDKLFRFGGEEFVVLLKPVKLEDALRVFERFRQTIADYHFPQVGQVTISIGFTYITAQDTPSQVIDAADEALYYAKTHGRNQVQNYEQLIENGGLQRKDNKSGDVELF